MTGSVTMTVIVTIIVAGIVAAPKNTVAEIIQQSETRLYFRFWQDLGFRRATLAIDLGFRRGMLAIHTQMTIVHTPNPVHYTPNLAIAHPQSWCIPPIHLIPPILV